MRLKTVSMKFMLFIAISSLFLSSVSAKDVVCEDPFKETHINGDTYKAKQLQPLKNIESNFNDHYVVGFRYEFEDTALIRASRRGRTNKVKQLLKCENIDVNAKNSYGRTALMQATVSGHTDIVELLLEHKDIDVYTIDYAKNTALALANQNGNGHIASILLDYMKAGYRYSLKNLDVNNIE